MSVLAGICINGYYKVKQRQSVSIGGVRYDGKIHGSQKLDI